MQTSKMLVGALWVLCAQGVYAGQVNNLTTFTPNTPAKAAEVNGNFSAVKSAVDDNDARINANTSTINNHEARIKSVEQKTATPEVGTLIDEFSSNYQFPPATASRNGYSAIGPTDANNNLIDYTPPYNARAFVQTRCSFDGNAAGQTLAHRVAVRPSSFAYGPQAFLGATTSGADMLVQDVNSDYFELTANTAYKFGVYFQSTPFGGKNPDLCSILVMVFRR